MSGLQSMNRSFRAGTAIEVARTIATKDMVEIINSRHIGNDPRFFRTMDISIEAEKVNILNCLSRLRNHETHISILASTPSVTAFSTALLIETIERRGILKKNAITSEDLLNDMIAKAGNLPNPLKSRFWFLEALIQEGIISSSYVDKSIKPTMSIPSTRDVFAIISEKTGISAERMKSSERSYDVVKARFFTIFILRKVCLLSLMQIGKCMGGRDHTTILNSLEQTRIRVFGDAGEARSALELCNIIDLLGQKRYCDFLQSQNKMQQVTRQVEAPERKVRLTPIKSFTGRSKQ